MAAIALLLIVAVPLLLGFALNFEQTEKTAWQSTQTVNVSNSLLNSSSPYFSGYNGPNNNQELVQVEDGAVLTGRLVSPAYNVTSANPSTIPYLNSLTNTSMTLTDASGTINDGPITGYIGSIPDTTGATEIARHDVYSKSVTLGGTDFTLYYSGGTSETIDPTGGMIYIYSLGGGKYSLAHYPDSTNLGSLYDDLVGIKISPLWQIKWMDSASINDIIGKKAYIHPPTNWFPYLQIIHSDNSFEAFVDYDISDTVDILIDVNTVFVTKNGELLTYNDVKSAKLYTDTHATNGTFTYSSRSQDPNNKLWADPAAGWKISLGSVYGTDDVVTWWSNGFANDSVRMLINIPAGSQTTLTQASGNPIVIENNGGTVTVNGQIIGNYTRLMVQFGQNTTTVSGITTWPSMGIVPTVYNSVSVDQNGLDFANIKIEDDLNVSYRIDAADIASGYYPTTKNYTFNPNGMFPNKSYNLVFTSVAFYGDSIGLAGTSYTVTDGKIVIDDQTVPLLRAEIRSIYNDETAQYDNTINGVPLASTATPAAIYFGGEWSLIAYYYGMEKVTETANEWKAGGFGLTEQGTIVVALLVDLAAFLGFGFYGRRTGTKVGWLLALCGGAGFVLLCML